MPEPEPPVSGRTSAESSAGSSDLAARAKALARACRYAAALADGAGEKMVAAHYDAAFEQLEAVRWRLHAAQEASAAVARSGATPAGTAA